MKHTKDKKPFYLSASLIKDYTACSLRYFYGRVLKVPQENNSGALAGTCAHTVLECLLKPRHKSKFDSIYSNKTITKCAIIKRYVARYVKKTGLSPEYEDKIGTFITTGVCFDFFSEGGKIIGAEIPFEIGSEEDGYYIRGFIDRLAIYNDTWASIRDYKSSKSKFSGADLEENIQALVYALAVKKLYPQYNLKTVVDFLFLAFPEEPKQRFPINGQPVTEDMLIDLEFDLKGIYKEISNFTAADRWKNVAYNNPPPEDGSWGGKLQCGFARTKGELKKNGDKKFHCPFRFDVDYFALLDEEGKISKTAFAKEELIPLLKEGYEIIEKNHPGCERFISKKK